MSSPGTLLGVERSKKERKGMKKDVRMHMSDSIVSDL